MNSLIELLAAYAGVNPADLAASLGLSYTSTASTGNSTDSSIDNVSNSYEANEYVNGVHVEGNESHEANEYVNGVHVEDDDSHEANEYVNGVHVEGNESHEANEYVNGVHVEGNESHEANEYSNSATSGDDLYSYSSTSSSSSTGYSSRSDDYNDQYQFGISGSEMADGDLIDAGELILSKYELGRRGWKMDRLDSDETLSVQVYNNEAFIIETEREGFNRTEFKIYSDLDGDQIWTEVVEGEVNTAAGSIDLVGLVNSGVIAPAMLMA